MEKQINVAHIELDKNATYYVRDGQLIKVDDLPRGFGTQTIVWRDGEPKCFDIKYTSQG
ncbi:hypothetical protein [Bacillus niameyensis]|uniref:hypothetical protein n=1 Tax=Bacillus niameyensis TaxID=1522308 RepID=UPI000B2C245F|nr:hypothetical protein [Bacillus niameyensis]